MLNHELPLVSQSALQLKTELEVTDYRRVARSRDKTAAQPRPPHGSLVNIVSITKLRSGIKRSMSDEVMMAMDSA